MDNIDFVVENSKDVTINEKNIDIILEDINVNDFSHWSFFSFFDGIDERKKIIFAFILESMNFCFWLNYDWNCIEDSVVYSGTEMLYKKVKDLVIKYKFDIEKLCNISIEDFYKSMGENGILPPMVDERYNSYKETLKVISKNDFFDKLYNIYSDIELEKFISDNIVSFCDKSYYLGRTIVFNKRCRLLINDLFLISDNIRKNIKNLNNLKGCADYSLPRYFREQKILKYSKRLNKIIEDEEKIPHGSTYEIEIRASTLYVIEIIRKKLSYRGIKLNSLELDNILWKLSRINKTSKPHHTISIYY